MSLNRYKIALEVAEEWQKDVEADDFRVWVKGKIKPKDPLFEKWKTIVPWDVIPADDSFAKAKELGIFTAGLDEAIEGCKSIYSGGTHRDDLIKIKERLENK